MGLETKGAGMDIETSLFWCWTGRGCGDFFVLTQFPRESAMRFSREKRFTFFLELL
jgi:hypothetical protein